MAKGMSGSRIERVWWWRKCDSADGARVEMRVQRDRTGDSVAGVDVIVWGPVSLGVQAAVAHVMEPQRRSSIVDGWRGQVAVTSRYTSYFCYTVLPNLSANFGLSSRQ
jgi:hypothetical protein